MGGKIYYEISFVIAQDNTSKFNKIVAFSKFDISNNYATKLYLHFSNIRLHNLNIPIVIIAKWNIDIRPCEMSNFCLFFGKSDINFTRTKKYEEFMQFLTQKEITLLEIVKLNDKEYGKIKLNFGVDKLQKFFLCLDEARSIIAENKPGKNILSYLLHTMNNKVIKNQRYKGRNPKLSNLFLENGSIPFDEMPFCSSLLNHNPTLINLFECIDISGRKHELLARKVKNNSEVNGYLYIDTEEIKDFLEKDNVDDLMQQYNYGLYNKKHRPHREIRKIHNRFLCIYEYENTIKEIMGLLGNFAQEGIENYQNNVEKWLNEKESDLDSEEKKDCLKKLFCNSKLALIYGAAGTGKTTMIEYISDFFKDRNKLYLANTHTAVNNLRQRLKSEKSQFSTIASMKKKQESIEYDIVIIDECSTISNADIKNIL